MKCNICYAIFPNSFEGAMGIRRHLWLLHNTQPMDGLMSMNDVEGRLEKSWIETYEKNKQQATPSYVIRLEERAPRKQIWLPDFKFHVGVAACVALYAAIVTDSNAPFGTFLLLWLTWIVLQCWQSQS